MPDDMTIDALKDEIDQQRIEINELRASNRKLDEDAAHLEIAIESLEHDNQQLGQNVEGHFKALEDVAEIRRAGRQLLDIICHHKDTTPGTEIMLKLVMELLWRSDDVGDIPF